MVAQSPEYMAFLLRLWCVHDADGIQWRASLEDAQTGERQGFANLERLCEFLAQSCTNASDPSLKSGN
jgi:hypothetical protein